MLIRNMNLLLEIRFVKFLFSYNVIKRFTNILINVEDGSYSGRRVSIVGQFIAQAKLSGNTLIPYLDSRIVISTCVQVNCDTGLVCKFCNNPVIAQHPIEICMYDTQIFLHAVKCIQRDRQLKINKQTSEDVSCKHIVFR